MNKNLFAEILFLILLNFLVFNNTLNNDFVWDDHEFISDNPTIKDLSVKNLYGIFSLKEEKGGMYKPITLLSFAIDYKTGGGNPFCFHLSNLMLTSLNSILLLLITAEWTGNKKTALITAVIFSVHPVHTDSVAWISERKDVLSVFFFLLSYIFYTKYSAGKNKLFYIFSIILFIPSPLSKISTITLPFILILHDYFLREDFSVKKSYRYIPFFLISAIVSYNQLFIMKTSESSITLNEKYLHLNIFETVVTILLMYGKYFKMFIFPINLNVIYINPSDIKNLPLYEVIIFPLIAVGILAMAFLLRKKARLISFCLLWFMITLLPNLYYYRSSFSMATRYLYLPSAGMCLIIAILLHKIYTLNTKGKYISLSILILLIPFYSLLTVKQNDTWKDDLTFWQKAYEKIPNSTYIQSNLAIAYMKKGNTDAAIDLLNNIISVEKNNYRAYILLGEAFEEKGEYQPAVDVYEKASRLEPGTIGAYIKLGALYYKVKKYELSYQAYSKALKIDPTQKEIKEFLPYLKQLLR